MKRTKKALFLSFFFVYAAVARSAPGMCEMHVTGDLNLNFQVPQTIPGISTPGDAAAVTDYWKTDDELRSEYMTKSRYLRTNESDADIKRAADAMLAKDPKSVVLNIICGKDQVLLTLVNGKNARYSNVPMKPGSYKILPPGEAGPSNMTGIVMVTNSGKQTSYGIARQGQLDLTQFDLKGIAGKFSLAAQKGTSTLRISGTFHYICQGKKRV